jgi:hypothetical protein
MLTPQSHSTVTRPLPANVDLDRAYPLSNAQADLDLDDQPVLESETSRDRKFVGMLKSFRASGGLLRGDEVVDLIALRRGEGTPNLSKLGRQIASRELVSFEWRGQRWLPLFQFQLADMALRDEVRRIATELAPVKDGWSVALWFSQPNPWLAQRTPVDALRDDFATVMQAARAARFDALGE